MKFVEYINLKLKEQIDKTDNLVVFGQNINAGSCLSGLTRGLSGPNNNITVLNTPNSENCLVGVGFGLMLNDVHSIFFMKQLDFLLLGIDQIVNTYNVLRQTDHTTSFTIFPITMDSGYEGPQASLNNLMILLHCRCGWLFHYQQNRCGYVISNLKMGSGLSVLSRGFYRMTC